MSLDEELKAIAKILEPNLGFPLRVDGGSGILMVQRADLTMLGAIAVKHGLPKEAVADSPDVMNAIGAFSATIMGRPAADLFLQDMAFKKQIGDRSTMLLGWLQDMRPQDIGEHAGGVSYSRHKETEKIFLRNLINLADRAKVACVVIQMDIGISEELRQALAARYKWAKSDGPVLLDLENGVHRRLAIKYLGCSITETSVAPPDKGARTRLTRHQLSGRTRSPKRG